ncbi:MAG: hypothetical protein EOP88_13550 [Verrucomicrobiaceae bacterium]|nr:MAG: hypothetical protein EOP88_13550 [Verrucomicrobiaceae bacterium]
MSLSSLPPDGNEEQNGNQLDFGYGMERQDPAPSLPPEKRAKFSGSPASSGNKAVGSILFSKKTHSPESFCPDAPVQAEQPKAAVELMKQSENTAGHRSRSGKPADTSVRSIFRSRPGFDVSSNHRRKLSWSEWFDEVARSGKKHGYTKPLMFLVKMNLVVVLICLSVIVVFFVAASAVNFFLDADFKIRCGRSVKAIVLGLFNIPYFIPQVGGASTAGLAIFAFLMRKKIFAKFFQKDPEDPGDGS